MLTVIIPAYNEEKCIEKTLSELTNFSSLEVEVIVLPNGCTDNTAEFVRAKYPSFKVVELETGSKVLAINKGLEIAKFGHVLVQDADVIINAESVRNILKFIESEDYLFASPNTRIIQDGSFLTNKYYSFLKLTPAYRIGMVNSGAYLISPNARDILGEFPQVIADDGYVKGTLGTANLTTIPSCYSVVMSPRTIWSLIKIKTRSKLGNMELKKKFTSPTTGGNSFASLFKIAIKEQALFQFLIYAMVISIATLRAKLQIKKLKTIKWERDESTRI
ncbi:glycosyltransferase family 2 protein [Pseudoalteromonas ostreae]|uniref:glycosyltransferase family 2 protein n=1 Tax=Pseudoalteromonas ostreae TaxID=2774154 RepID=UPI001B36847B|nr:glycosyltransferase family 2 protein [Pseudoalteromonas ostreae]